MGSTSFNHANRIWVQTEPYFTTSASPFPAAWGQATSSLKKPSHPSPAAGTGQDVVDNFFSFFCSSLIFSVFQGTAKHVTAPSFTEMIPSCQNALEEVLPPVSLSPKAMAEQGFMLCDPRQCGGVLRVLGRRNCLAQLPAMKVGR